jgi:FkbM family methyltransferase
VTLKDILGLDRLTAIVDVGAGVLDEKPPYQRMLEEGLCTVVGFDPIIDGLKPLIDGKGPNERYLDCAIGSNSEEWQLLYLTQHRGMVSFLEPDPSRANLFSGFNVWTEVKHIKPLKTRRLDEIEEIEHIDFLKIDAQGYELEILNSAGVKLQEAVAIQAEAAFFPIYKKQPTFADLDHQLRGLGFIPHCFAGGNIMPLATMASIPRCDPHQIVDADVLYMRDFARPMENDQWKHMAMVAHHIAGSYDLAMMAVMYLERQGVLPPDAAGQYRAILETRIE